MRARSAGDRFAVPLLALALASSLSPVPLAAQDDRAAGLFTTARQLPLVSQSIAVRLDGGDALVELVQVFANDGEEAAQADYRLHLPAGTSVDGFGYWRGERFLAAELREREEAAAAHAAAVTAGGSSGLLTASGPVASFSVVPLPARSLQRVALTLRLPVVADGGRSALRLPLDELLGAAHGGVTAVVRLATAEPLHSFGVDGASFVPLARAPRRAELAFTAEGPVELWWAEESVPLLVRAEGVPLPDGSLAAQLRLRLDDAAAVLRARGRGGVRPGPREVVLFVDGSFSMRRRAPALDALLRRVQERARVPVRVYLVGEQTVEVTAGDPGELARALRGGYAGFVTGWDDLLAAAAAQGCGRPETRCVAVTDPQVDLLPERSADPSAAPPFATLFLADAEELAYFGDRLPTEGAVYQPDVEPRAKLRSIADGWTLPALELVAVEQAGGTFELEGMPGLRAAQGALLRLPAVTRSTAPLMVRLRVDGREVRREVELLVHEPEASAGRAVRRALFAARLADWEREHRLSRDPELRARIVALSLNEGIPTSLTSLQVADGELPSTATPAALLRRIGALLLAAGLLMWARGRW